MTKHNAEMENSREQSRVCARLPPKIPAKMEQTPTQRGQRAAPAPVSVIADMVKRAADCILVLAKRSFPLPG